MEIHVTRIDGALHINPAPPYLTKYLQYTKRGMEMVGWKKETVYTKIQLHKQCDDGSIVTFRGFYRKIEALIAKNGDTMVTRDNRTPLPEIDREAVLKINFREHQIPLMVEILDKMQQDDGIVWAATGAGKTHISAGIYAAYNNLNTVIAVPLAAVATQTYKIFKELFPDKDVGLVGAGGSHIGEHVTIATLASLDKCSLEKCKLLLVDEIQCVTSQRMQDIITAIPALRVIGFTATDEGLFNKGDKVLTALFGDRLCEMNYQDAQAIEAVVPGVVYFLEVPEQATTYSNFDNKMKYAMKIEIV
jgi:superfamily II DNA or RNA helicase